MLIIIWTIQLILVPALSPLGIGLIKKIKANGRICSCHVCDRAEGKCPYKGKDFDPRFTHEYIGFNFKTTEFIFVRFAAYKSNT